jgi:hypothetical protein
MAGTASAWASTRPYYMGRLNIFWWDTKLMQMFERDLNHGREPSFESFCKILIETWSDNGFLGCSEWTPKKKRVTIRTIGVVYGRTPCHPVNHGPPD